MTQRITFGLVGAGGISNSQHLSNLSWADGIFLKTVCDLDEGKVQAARAGYGIPHGATDIGEILRDDEIQAVVLATKAEAHEELIARSLDAGKHVYCEKPLSTEPEAAERIAAKARNSERFVVVGHNRRAAPAVRRVLEIIAEKGRAYSISYRIADNYRWWGRNEPPGMRVIHEICHVFDLMLHLTASRCSRVYTAVSRDDEEVFVLHFENGSVATILSGSYTGWDLPKERMEIMLGDSGTVVMENFAELQNFGMEGLPDRETFRGHIHSQRSPLHAPLIETLGVQGDIAYRRAYTRARLSSESEEKRRDRRGRQDEYLLQHALGPNYAVNKGWTEAMEHFADCIRGNRKPFLTDPVEALHVARITAAAIRSRETGNPQSVC